MESGPEAKEGLRLWHWIRGTIYLLVGGFVLLTAIFAIFYFSSKSGMEAFCSKAIPGMPVSGFKALAKSEGIRLKPLNATTNSTVQRLLAYDIRSHGRHSCMIEHDGLQVIGATVSFLD